MSPVSAPFPKFEDFEARVKKAQGGRVDFVFGDERPFAQCHASTLAQAPDGRLLCAWFGGTEESDPDVGIWLSQFEGATWSAPVRVAKVRQEAHWNPVLFTAPDGTVWLFFKVGPEIPQWMTYVTKSPDSGRTWLAAEELVPGDHGGRGPVRNKPVVLSDGAWLAPASTEREDKQPGAWAAFVDRSEDNGRSWTRSANFEMDPAVITGAGVIQPTLWESKPGTVHALLRSTGGVVGRCDSSDGGRTWTPIRATSLPNNNSGIDALGLGDGRVLLVYNPIGKNWGARSPLSLALSADNGETWTNLAHLEDDAARLNLTPEQAQDKEAVGEYSYPAIVRTKTGVALCYTWRRQRVRCWQFPLSVIEG